MKSTKQPAPNCAAETPAPLYRFEDAPKFSGVYYIFLNGVLLYIGKAANIRTRIAKHRCHVKTQKKLAWTPLTCHPDDLRFSFLEIPNIDMIDAVERLLIAQLRPPYNRLIDGRRCNG